MAKIYGFELKGLKTFKGMEGVGFNANLYLNNKKIGEIIDSADGGEMDVSLDYKLSDEQRDEIYGLVAQYFIDHPKHMYYDTKYAKLNEMIEELYELKETESFFKKSIKKGSIGVICLHYSKRADKPDYDNYKMEQLYSFGNIPSVEKLIRDEKPAEYEMYKALTDFIIVKK